MFYQIYNDFYSWLSGVTGWSFEALVALTIGLVVFVVLVPKRFLKLSPHVADRQAQRQIPYRVIIGICRKAEFRGWGFKDNPDIIYYNLNSDCWAGVARNGTLETVYKYGMLNADGGMTRTYNTTSEGYNS